MNNFNGHENGIDWKISLVEDGKYEIEAYNTQTNAIFKGLYTCSYPCIFGFDVYDNQQIEDLIDKAIKTVSE